MSHPVPLPPASAAGGAAAQPAQPAGAAPVRVLVVDDDVVDRMAVRRGLKRAGAALVIDEAEGAVDALARLAEATYDCVFLDFNIPGGSGLTLLRRMREQGVDAPVVMLTGQGDEQVAVELMKAGAADYMPKSAATPERLDSSLRYAVELARAAAGTRRAQQELRASAERARFLASASEILASSLDRHTTLERVAQLAVPLLGDYCFIFLAAGSGSIPAVASAHADPAQAELAREIVRLFQPPVNHPTSRIARTLETGRTQLLERVTDEHLVSISSSTEEAAAHRALGASTALFVPLAARTTLGVIVFCRTGAGATFTPEEITLAEDLGRRAATALDNSRLYADARRSRARTERLQAVTARLAAVLSQAEVVDLFVTEVREALDADSAWISLLSADGTELEAVADVGFEAAVIGRFARLPVRSQLPSGDVLLDGHARWFSSRADLLARYPELGDSLDDLRQEGLAVLPLPTAKAVLGVISIGFRERHDFGDEERALAIALAQQCAQALERAWLYDAERVSRHAAEEANRAKSEFLARMSHDLRTPLNAIGGYAQLIEEGVYGGISDGQRQSLERIRRAQQHLLMLINDILSFAKLEAGQVRMTLAPVAVQALLVELKPLLEPQAEAKGLHLELTANVTPVIVQADKGRLAQIIVNLLTNAVKFTDPGGRIDVSAESRDETAVMRVRDTGRGIPPERLAAIFDPFVQASGAADASREGVGLGLAISRELARLMHGELTVESAVGVGSTFTLVLPRTAHDDAGLVAATIDAAHVGG